MTTIDAVSVQRICCQCDERFTPDINKCPKCIANPKRKNKFLTVYDAPTLVSTMAAKSVRQQLTTPEWEAMKRYLKSFMFFKCQRSACTNLMLRRVKLDGTMAEKLQFCSVECTILAIGKERRDRIVVKCACGCGKEFDIKPSLLKRNGRSYFSHRHYSDHRLGMQKKFMVNHSHKCSSCPKKWDCKKPECKSEHSVCERCFGKLGNEVFDKSTMKDRVFNSVLRGGRE
jgi:hypothetical protein